MPATLAAPATQYADDGYYLQSAPILPSDLIARAVAGQDALRQGQYDTGRPPEGGFWKIGDAPSKLVKVEQPQAASKAIYDVVSHPAIGELAARITGAKMVQVWWVQMLIKPPHDPAGPLVSNVGWHQDRYYWGQWEPNSELFTAWVALSDVDESAGPMKFLQGSHKWGFRQASDFFAQDLEGQKASILPPGETWREVSAVMKPGGLSFHHHLTFHGSGPNLSGKPRRSLALHLRTEKSRPIDNKREGLTKYIDDPSYCPVIHGKRADAP